MNAMMAVFKRELSGYFATPVAYVFLVIFLVVSGVTTFQLGSFFDRGQADLLPFFQFHPWLYLFLIPALSMRLWAEERRGGTIELLMTLPMPTWAPVVGKYLAAWAFTGIALLLTAPMWIAVNRLGEPDNGAIFAGYLGSLLMAGGFLAVGSAVSAATKSQVVAFIISVVVCFVFLLLGFGPVQEFLTGWGEGWAPAALAESASRFSFLTQFDELSRGVIDGRSLLFFGSLIGCAMVANLALVESSKQ